MLLWENSHGVDQCSHVLGKYDLTLVTFQINSELICVCVIPPNALAHHMNVRRPECADGEYHFLSTWTLPMRLLYNMCSQIYSTKWETAFLKLLTYTKQSCNCILSGFVVWQRKKKFMNSSTEFLWKSVHGPNPAQICQIQLSESQSVTGVMQKHRLNWYLSSPVGISAYSTKTKLLRNNVYSYCQWSFRNLMLNSTRCSLRENIYSLLPQL